MRRRHVSDLTAYAQAGRQIPDRDGPSLKSARRRQTTSERVGGNQQVLICLSLLCTFYAWASWWCTNHTPMVEHAKQAEKEFGLDKFSEKRARHHVNELAKNIGHRQEGKKGLGEAAAYIKHQLHSMAASAGARLRVEVEEASVAGSFSLTNFLDYNMTISYSGVQNIVVRVSSLTAAENDPAVLFNAHYDSPIGSPGAADCAACVACLLEALRVVIHNGEPPASPLIFLFNGAEENFLLGAHGFVTSHRWWPSVGAVVNVESSGSSGPDMVIQMGLWEWPVHVYAQHAPWPSGSSVAQDVFPYIPGDTDFRMFAHDLDDVPGLDIVSVLNGYVYHTEHDTLENLRPGYLQSLGENMMALVGQLPQSAELRTRAQRRAMGRSPTERGTEAGGNPVFFDIFGRRVVHYSHSTALALHTLPLLMVLLAPWLATPQTSGTRGIAARYASILAGAATAAVGLVFCLAFSAAPGILRVIITGRSMPWYSRPMLAYAVSIPAAVAGLLCAHALHERLFHAASGKGEQQKKQVALDWAGHWGGTVGFSALLGLMTTVAGGGGGYIGSWWALMMMPALTLFQRFQALLGSHSALALVGYLVCGLVPSTYCMSFFFVFCQFIAEKMGMTGTQPRPLGPLLPDLVFPVAIGLAVHLAFAPFASVARRWLARSHIISALLLLSLAAAAATANLFPYSHIAIKRFALQRTIWTNNGMAERSEYALIAFDAIPSTFAFEHIPALAQEVGVEVKDGRVLLVHGGGGGGGGDAAAKAQLRPGTSAAWLGWYPVTMLTQGDVVYSLPKEAEEKEQQPQRLPTLQHTTTTAVVAGKERRRVSIEIDLGTVEEIWVTVVNVTGSVLRWSLAEGAPDAAPHVGKDGSRCRIIRLVGKPADERWKFWLETRAGGEPLQLSVAVLSQKLSAHALRVMPMFPEWSSVLFVQSFLSNWTIQLS